MIKQLNFLVFTLLILSTPHAFAKEKQGTLKQFQQAIAAQRGNVVYVDFWASWCIPCRESFPWMNEMQSQYAAQGLKIITVNLDAVKANATEFLASYPAEFDIIYDPKGKIARKFKLPGMPSSIIYNRQGEIVETHVGFNDVKKAQYQQTLINLLAQ